MRAKMTNAEIMTIVFSGVVAITGVVGTIIFNNQLSVMQGQLDVMRTEQRPWISLSMQVDGPLVHDGNGWNLLIKYGAVNVGKSPAFDVDFLATMIPWGPPQPRNDGSPTTFPDVAADVHAATEKICNAMETFRASGSSGRILFPTEEQGQQFRVHPSGPINGEGFIRDFIVIGCATYRFPNDPETHRTVRIIDVSKSAYGELINLGGETIPLEGLSPVLHPGGTFAN